MNARSIVVALLSVSCAVLVATVVAAERERRPEPRPGEEADSPARERPDFAPREQPRADMRERESREGTADGWPGDLSAPGARIMPPGHPQWHFPPRWWLGVYGYNTPSGVVITRVVPDSPAEHAGLERNDKIVTVDGFQVGYIQRRLYPLGAELQLRAGPDGRVLLLVQNWRNDELENIDARLASGGVRDREFRLPGFQQGDERSQ